MFQGLAERSSASQKQFSVLNYILYSVLHRPTLLSTLTSSAGRPPSPPTSSCWPGTPCSTTRQSHTTHNQFSSWWVLGWLLWEGLVCDAPQVFPLEADGGIHQHPVLLSGVRPASHRQQGAAQQKLSSVQREALPISILANLISNYIN